MYEALLVVFLIVAIGLVGLIMLQQGKGADMGASFGAGASATLFGSSGSGNFMTRMTALLATLFFIISLVLGNINSNKLSNITGNNVYNFTGGFHRLMGIVSDSLYIKGG